MALDAVGVVALDTNLGGLDGSRELYQKIITVGHIASKRAFDPFRDLCYKYLPFLEGARRDAQQVDSLTREWDRVAREVLERENPADGEESMWFAMKCIEDPSTNEPIGYEDLREVLAVAVLGGMDTTGHQLSWVLALLACHPHVTDSLLKELEARGHYGAEARAVLLEDLGELSYLTAVIKESMRIASIVSTLLFRRVPEDMTLMGYRIPRGTFVTIPGTRWIDAEEEWGDHDVFRPERWLADEDMSRKLYFPFSYGPRDCVGQKLAMLEMRLATIKLVTKYDLALKKPFRDLMRNSRIGLVIESKEGIMIDVSLRIPPG